METKEATRVGQKALKFAKKERAFQIGIEKMQIANATANYSKDARVKRAEDEMNKIEKHRKTFAETVNKDGKPLQSAMVLTFLANLFAATLAKLSEASFLKEAKVDAGRFMSRALSPVTAEQKAIVTEYYDNKAKANWESVESIREFLAVNKALKAPKKGTALPTEKEVADLTNQE